MKTIPSLIPRFTMDYSLSDFFSSLFSIFTKRKCDLDILKSTFGDKHFYFTNSGRSALYIILRALKLPTDSEVGVPVYSCPVVWGAIKKAGLVPRFIDIDISTYTMDPVDLKRKVNGLKAIIVIHSFGYPADMDNIKKIADGIPIIEDCAHALFSEYKKEKTGLIGNASIYSFGLGKYLSTGGGGLIILNDKTLINAVEKEMSILESQSELNQTLNSCKSFIHSFLYKKPWFGSFVLSVGSSMDKYIDIREKYDFSIKKIGKGNLCLFLRKLKHMDEKIRKQRSNSKLIGAYLTTTSLIQLKEVEGIFCSYYLYPIRFQDKEIRDRACNLLRENGVDSARYWETFHIAKSLYEYKGDCPNSEIVAKTIATIPNYHTLSKNEIIKIANLTKKIVNSL